MPIPAISNPSWLTKRRKIVLVATTLAVMMAAVFWGRGEQWGVVILLVASYIGTAWALDWDLRREEWVVIPLYLLLTTATIYSWLMVFAHSWQLIIGGALAYGLASYVVLLAVNILNLATVKTMPLARTATTVMSLVGLSCGFSLFYLLLINQPDIWRWTVFAGVIGALIAWPLTWVSLPPGGRIGRSLAWSSLIAWSIVQVALIVGFWPGSFMTSLFITSILGIMTGLIHHLERRQLTRRMQWQYYMVGGILLVILYVASVWQ